MHRLLLLPVTALLAAACASAPPAATSVGAQATADTLNDPRYVPAGFGTLRQDDIAVRVSLTGGLQVRAIPLDETFIRLLSPDSYKAMRDLIETKRADLEKLQQRYRMPSYSLWYVSFFAQEQGETRFSPMEVIIRNVGQDFRPLDVFALTPGFGQYRLRQREVQSGLFAFDGRIDLNQPLSMVIETTEGGNWRQVLQRVERERALVRSRAQAAGRRPPE